MTPLISDHLNTLGERIDHYFPSLPSENYDWVGDPFAQTASNTNISTLKEEEELAELSSDQSLKLKHAFWIMTEKEHPNIAKIGLCIFFCSSPHPTCVNSGFQRLQILNRLQRREKLKCVEEENESLFMGNSSKN